MTVVADSIGRNCRQDFRAAHDSGPRSARDVHYIVVHAAETDDDPRSGLNARGVALWFQRQDSGGSANITVDWARCYMSLPDLIVPWGAPPLNRTGFHIEHCARTAWPRWRWLTPWSRLMLRRSAYRAALRAHKYGIPLVELDVAALKADFGDVNGRGGTHHGGVVRHKTVSLAYGQTDHTDPGDGFPIDVWLGYARAYRTNLD